MQIGQTNLIFLMGWAEALAAASQESEYECILVPSEIAGLAAKKEAEALKVGEAVKSGQFDKLTIQQVQKIAQANSISIARTKSDFMKLLKPYEPLTDFEHIKPAQLKTLIQKHKIGALRSKEELIDLIKNVGKAPNLGADLTLQKINSLKSEVTQGCKQVWDQGFNDYVQTQKQLTSASNSLKELKSLIPEEEFKALQLQYEQAQKAFVESKKSLSGNVIKKLAQDNKILHYQWASKEDLVTIMTSGDAAEIAAVQHNIEVKWLKWSEKHGKKVPSITPTPSPVTPAKPPSKPKPKPIIAPEPLPMPPAKPVNWSQVDTDWEKFSSGNPFKYQGKADIEGAHTKYFFTDNNGEKWLFKPAEEFRAFGDEAAYKIGRLIDANAVEARYVKLSVPGSAKPKAGSIQKWRTDLKADFDFRNIPVEKLTAVEIEQLQREHVLDWLISNHDGHAKQFLRTVDDKILAIDKGQLYKFIGDDKLSVDYHPNYACGEAEPFYNILMRGWREGKLEMNLQSTYRYIQEVEKITDAGYIELLSPYAESRFKNQPLKLKQFYETALARKQSLKTDFENFYTELLRQRSGDAKVVFRFENGIKDIKSKDLASGRLPKEAEQWVDDINEAGWQGRTLPIDVEDIEDQNVLFYTEEIKGLPRTVARLKIRPEAEKKLLTALQEQAEWSKGVSKLGLPLKEDIYYDDMLSAVKTINHHIGSKDFKYNRETVTKVLTTYREKLAKLALSKDKDLSAMAKTYSKTLDEIAESVKKRGKLKIGEFKQYVKRHDDNLARKSVKPDLRVETHNELRLDKKTVRQGKISVEQENVSLSKLCSSSSGKGIEYEIDFGNGVTGIYRPWDSSNNYAHQGILELRISEKCTVKTVENLLGNLERLGVKATLATVEEAEILYLSKLAYIRKEDTTPGWKGLMKKLEVKNTSQIEKVKVMREYWSNQLGVDDVTKIPGYNPEGKFSIMHSTWKQRKQAGFRLQERFDITEEILEKEMKDCYLYHRVTNDSNISNFIDDVLKNNGAMVSTMEKMRCGIPVGGMSPGSDMSTGGANYFFTRIRQVKAKGSADDGLYFKKTMLKRMDAITYDSDKFGRVTGNTVRSHRLSNIEDWKKIAQREGSDETIFKNHVTLLDNIDLIIVNTESKREGILKAFRKNGITSLPDGRPVPSIVQVR